MWLKRFLGSLQLTHFSPIFHLYTLKTKGFLMFSVGIELEHWAKMGYKA